MNAPLVASAITTSPGLCSKASHYRKARWPPASVHRRVVCWSETTAGLALPAGRKFHASLALNHGQHLLIWPDVDGPGIVASFCNDWRTSCLSISQIRSTRESIT